MQINLLQYVNDYFFSNSIFFFFQNLLFFLSLYSIANIDEAYQFSRAFRLDAFFTWKDSFESVFAGAIEHTKHKLAGLKQNPAWDR